MPTTKPSTETNIGGFRLNGEWVADLEAFYYNVHGHEYLASKGSNEIIVQAENPFAAAPAYVLQHTAPINTVDDFNEALLNGKRFAVVLREMPTTAGESAWQLPPVNRGENA